MALHRARPPLLVIVSGKPGSGKTTLACRLGEPDALNLPVLSRDAIKAGLEDTCASIDDDGHAASVVRPSFEIFYGTIESWLRAGVSLIAEHSYRRGVSEAELRPLTHLARVVVIRCDTTDTQAGRRFAARERAHGRIRRGFVADLIDQMNAGSFDWSQFDLGDLGAPVLCVDTTATYEPTLPDIVNFCRASATEDALPTRGDVSP